MLYDFFQDNQDGLGNYFIIIPNGIGAIAFIVLKIRARDDDSTEISSKCETGEYSD